MFSFVLELHHDCFNISLFERVMLDVRMKRAVVTLGLTKGYM